MEETLSLRLDYPSKKIKFPRLVPPTDSSLSDLNEYLRDYLSSLNEIALLRFSTPGNRAWFNQLKTITKYNSFAKRDGSIATCCLKDNPHRFQVCQIRLYLIQKPLLQAHSKRANFLYLHQ